jgi:Ni/Co efflux regulator RcnB
MKMYRTVPSLLAAVLAISLAGPGVALADDNRRNYDRHDYGSHQDRQHSRHNSREHHGDRHNYKRRHAYADKHDRRHYKQGRRHYKQDRHHYKHDRHHYNRHNYAYRYDDDDDEKLLIGLVLGGLIGYAINNAYDPDIYDD